MTGVFVNDIAVVVGYPPIYNRIVESGLQPGPRAVYAWGDKIYNPSGGRVSGDIIAHEKVHMRQQREAGGIEKWWERYLAEPRFLLDQEAQAYSRQFQYLCSQNPNRNFQFQILQALAMTLCGPMYNHVCTMDEAMTLIREQHASDS